MEAVQITATDPRSLHFDENLTSLWCGISHLSKTDITRTMKYCCLHCALFELRK
jgi:hypothetical protein